MIRRFVRFIRLKDWFYMLGIPLLAMAGEPFRLDNIAILFIVSLYLACGYSFNNAFDIGNDNRRKNMLSKGMFGPGFFLAQVIGITLLFVSYFYSKVLVIIFTIQYILNLLYSAPPFRLKDKGLLAVPINAVFFSSIYVVSKIKTFSHNDILPTALLFFLFIFLHSIHEMEHKRQGWQFVLAIVSLAFLNIIALPLGMMVLLTGLYTAGCILLMLKEKNAAVLRKRVRWLTIVAGLALATYLYRSTLAAVISWAMPGLFP